MSEPYQQFLAALRDRAALVYLDVQPPRDAPTRQFVASLFEPAPRPEGQAVSLAVTPEQASELLAAGAEWKGPTHMRTEVFLDTSSP
jgi:hypothetical protein